MLSPTIGADSQSGPSISCSGFFVAGFRRDLLLPIVRNRWTFLGLTLVFYVILWSNLLRELTLSGQFASMRAGLVRDHLAEWFCPALPQPRFPGASLCERFNLSPVRYTPNDHRPGRLFASGFGFVCWREIQYRINLHLRRFVLHL